VAANPGADVTDAEASHKASTDALLDWLPASTALGHGTLPFGYGDPSVVTPHYTLFNDDLEEELSNWPSFIASLAGDGGTLRTKKDVAKYRSATLDADMNDMPAIFKGIVEALVASKNLP